MPTHIDGYLIPFTQEQIELMEIRTFKVRDGSHPVEVMKWGERTMTRTFLVKWSERYNFLELVLGNEKLYSHPLDETGETFERRLSRLLPDLTYGCHPHYRQIKATEILAMRGHGAGIDNRDIEDEEDYDWLPGYTDAEVEVRYEFAPFVVGSDNAPRTATEMNKYVQLDGSVSGENEIFGPIPGGSLKAARSGGGGFSGRPMPYSFSISRAMEKLTLIWHRLPYECVTDLGALQLRLNEGDPADAEGMRPYRGTVNSHDMTFESFGRTFPAGTMLLDRTEFRTIRSPHAELGTLGLRVTVLFHYLYSPLGWLNLYLYDPAGADTGYYQAGDGTFHPVASFPDDRGLYCVRDHRKLFDFRYG